MPMQPGGEAGGYGGGRMGQQVSALTLTKEEKDQVAQAVADKLAGMISEQQVAWDKQVEGLKKAVESVASTLKAIERDQAMIKANVNDISCWMINLMQHHGLMAEDYGMHEDEEEELNRQAKLWGEGQVDMETEGVDPATRGEHTRS